MQSWFAILMSIGLTMVFTTLARHLATTTLHVALAMLTFIVWMALLLGCIYIPA